MAEKTDGKDREDVKLFIKNFNSEMIIKKTSSTNCEIKIDESFLLAEVN